MSTFNEFIAGTKSKHKVLKYHQAANSRYGISGGIFRKKRPWVVKTRMRPIATNIKGNLSIKINKSLLKLT